MSPQTALSLIEKAIPVKPGIWADLGAGTGTFTLALQEILPSGTIYAVDKSPHVLWALPIKAGVKIQVVEGDFTQSLALPQLDGILMANSLHYAQRPEEVLKNLLPHLSPGGMFLLIEYETHRPLPPWVPYPLPFRRFQEIAAACGLPEPVELARVSSNYGHEHIYSANCVVNIP